MQTRNPIKFFAGASAFALVTFLAAPVTAQTAAESDASAEIIVTATKRDQDVRDIAGSVSAVTEEQFQALNAQSLSDYITRVPGVVFNDYQPGVSEVVIRGVASTTYHEANQATTGYYINQIPLIEPGFPLVIPDIDAFDVRQVEVLRGPQGTLFGSSSLGGAINYVVNEADPTQFDAGAEGIISTTKRVDDVSYAAKGMINVPIIRDKLAARLVALQRYDAGYLDNTGTGDEGSNDLRVRGLRGSLVWTPTETTRISALGLYQEYDLDDQTYVLFDGSQFAPPFQFNKTYERNTNVNEFQDTDVRLYSLRFEQELGFGELTAIGSRVEKRADLIFDDSVFVGIDPRTGTAQLSTSSGKSTTDYAELRLNSTGDGAFTWLIGGNYTRLRSGSTGGTFIPGIATFIDANPGLFNNQPSSVIAPGDFITRTIDSNYVRELALFGEAAYTIADQFTLTLGGRLFEYRSRPRLQFLPNAFLIPQFDFQPGTQKQSDFIPKVSLSYKPNERTNIYALYSQGFRLGGLNVFSAAFGTPPNFDTDATTNYEVGARFDIVPDTFSIDVAAFHIDWKDIQVRLFTPAPDFRAFTINGGGADIDGVELTLTLRPTRDLSFVSSVSYNDARLSSFLADTFAPGGGYPKGSRLPGASEWIIANQLDLNLRNAPLAPRIGIAHRYVSKAPVAFGSSIQKGDYHIVDLNASFAVTEGLEAGLFFKNLFNEYGVLNAPFAFAGSVTRPRTLGASLRFSLN